MRGTVIALGAVLGVLVVAGCDRAVPGAARAGGAVASSGAPSSGAPASSAVSGGPSSTGAVPTTSPAPAPAPTTVAPTTVRKAPPPKGTPAANYAACADGNCEVAVTGPVNIPLGGHGGATTMSVRSVTSDSISYTTSGPDGSGSGDISGGGVVSFGGDTDLVTVVILRSVPGGVVIRLSTS